MTATLFSPITIGHLDLPNRIAVAPMCQYSDDDGSATDRHLQHWMTLAMSGAGMVTVEMTDVDGARKAISELDKHQYGGRSLTVNEARPMAARGNGEFAGGRKRRESRW